jgi:hypothetical protein
MNVMLTNSGEKAPAHAHALRRCVLGVTDVQENRPEPLHEASVEARP